MRPNILDSLNDIAKYYSDKLDVNGITPLGVDWNGEASQILRFEQLTKIISVKEKFELNDLGCGYGALYDYLGLYHKEFLYNGYDISSNMIRVAKDRHSLKENIRVFVAEKPSEIADYGIASGIFNVRLDYSDADWLEYIKKTIDAMNEKSRLGFSFNCLTIYSDQEKMKKHLYYADPCVLFDFCKKHYSKNVALLHDYNLYEFTILVRK